MVISCPCALVISIPLSFFAGIGGASKHGILVKGGDHLEALSFVDTIAFDKTGTLTKGRFEVCEISPSGGFGKDELLFFAAHAESVSPHPIAVSIINKYAKTIDPNIVSEGEDIFGLGVKAKINGRTVLAGNEKMMYSRGISHTKAASFGSVAYVAIDNVYAGYIAVADEIKEESFKITQELQKLNVNSVVMLTGDSKAVGEETAKLLNINEVFSELLPLDKVDKIETLLSKTPKGKKLAFVGDGVNDAPSLVKADIGSWKRYNCRGGRHCSYERQSAKRSESYQNF